MAGKFFGGVLGLLAALVPLTLFVLANGGITYRTSCAEPDGTVSTSWSYRIVAPLPYLLPPKREGCVSDNATRVVLSAVGIWALPSRSAAALARSGASNPGDAYYAGLYGIAAEFQQAARSGSQAKTEQALADGKTVLGTLAPPPYVAADAASFQTAWQKMDTDFRQAVRAPKASSRATISADYTRLAALTERIRRIVVANR